MEDIMQAILKAKKIVVIAGEHWLRLNNRAVRVFCNPQRPGRNPSPNLRAKFALSCHPAGAGISVAADIADFRSETGIFKTLMTQFPDLKLKTGKELFTWSNVFGVSDRLGMLRLVPLADSRI